MSVNRSGPRRGSTRIRTSLRLSIGACALLLPFSIPAFAATIIVDPAGGGDFTAIQPAIDAALPGDDILVKPGEYVSDRPVFLEAKAITVASERGPEETTIRLAEPAPDVTHRCVVLFEGGDAGSPVLAGFRLEGEKGAPAAAIHCLAGSSPSVADCLITDSGASSFAVYVAIGGAGRFSRCTISGNALPSQESAIWSGGSLTMVDCTVADNAGCGLMCSYGSAVLTNCTIAGNSMCGVYCFDAALDVENCIIWENGDESLQTPNPQAVNPVTVAYSCLEGAAVWPGTGNMNQNPLFCGWGAAAEVFVDPANPGTGDGTEGNPFSILAPAFAYSLALSAGSPCRGAGEGGADMGAPTGVCVDAGAPGRLVHLARGTYDMRELNVCHTVSLAGAGETETIIEGTVAGLRGGARISHVTVRHGIAGGIQVSPGHDAEIVRCTITENASAILAGAGIRCLADSRPVIRNCTITSNRVNRAGGGIYCGLRSSPVIADCIIQGNSTVEEIGRYGGGIYVDLDASPAVTNCIISGNRAPAGAGVYCGRESRPTLRNCTIGGNPCYRSWDTSEVYAEFSFLAMVNCIVWGAAPPSLVERVDGDSRLIVGRSCIAAAEPWPGDRNINLDPLFIDPGRWDDRETPNDPHDDVWIPGDYRCRSGSPAIDAGASEGAPAADIEGNTRPCWDAIDMGAYEYCGAEPPMPLQQFRRGDANADGGVDIGDAVSILGYLFGAAGDPSKARVAQCLVAADANDDGMVDIADAIKTLSHLFASAGPLPPPFVLCGIDPTADGPECIGFAPCEGP